MEIVLLETVLVGDPLYIFKICGALYENFVQAHSLKASFHYHLRELSHSNQYFLNMWTVFIGSPNTGGPRLVRFLGFGKNRTM